MDQPLHVIPFAPDPELLLKVRWPATPRPKWSLIHHSLPAAARKPKPQSVSAASPAMVMEARVSDGVTEK